MCSAFLYHRRATFISRTIRREDAEVTEDEAKVQARYHVLDSNASLRRALSSHHNIDDGQVSGKKMKENDPTLCWLLLCSNLNQKHHGRVENRKKIDLKWRMTTFNQILSWLLEPVPCWPNYSKHSKMNITKLAASAASNIAGIPSRSKLSFSSPTTVFAHCWW
jgi:hypothetical protein